MFKSKKSYAVEYDTAEYENINSSNTDSMDNSTCVKCQTYVAPDADDTQVFSGLSQIYKAIRAVKSSKIIRAISNVSIFGTPSNDRIPDAEPNRTHTMLSPDGLCLRCEIHGHPERFHGCAFCRRPLRNLYACTVCRLGFTEWLNGVGLDNHSHSNSHSNSHSHSVMSKILESGYIVNREFVYIESQSLTDYEWPGFYAGLISANTENAFLPAWVIPKTLRIMPMSNVDTDAGLLKLLEQNNIHLYNNVQIDLAKFDSANILKVITFNDRN